MVAIRLEDHGWLVGHLGGARVAAQLRASDWRRTEAAMFSVIYSGGSDSDIRIFHGCVNQRFPWLKLFTRLCFPL